MVSLSQPGEEAGCPTFCFLPHILLGAHSAPCPLGVSPPVASQLVCQDPAEFLTILRLPSGTCQIFREHRPRIGALVKSAHAFGGEKSLGSLESRSWAVFPPAGQLQRMQPALVIATAQSDLFYFSLLFINIWKFGNPFVRQKKGLNANLGGREYL